MPKIQLNFKHFFVILAISSFLLSSFFVFCSKTFAATGINRTINFQGKLVTNPQGTNVSDTTYTVVFTLYNNPTAGQGTALWTETQTVTTTDGIFRVALGSVTPIPSNFNFNWDGLYLGIKVNSDAEMTPRVQMAAVPFAFNAQQVAGLTVQDTSGNASTSGTLQVPNAKTINLGTQNLTFTTSADTTLTLPTSGTLLTNTTAANQTITSTQATGTLLGLTDSTGLSGAITGMAITLSGTGAQDQTGLSFNLSGASGTNLNDIVGTGSSWKISRTGALTVASCSGCGGAGGTNYWGLTSGGTTGGLLYNGNQTTDFAIGGVSTTSALFSYTGVLTGHTIASASGNLILMANNGWGGQVGIGQNIPAETLDVNGNIKLGTATTGTIRATDELVLRQDGDTYGSSILRLRNRTGENGAIFETTDPTVTLVDFIFKTASNQRNIRYESRAASAKVGNPSFHIGGATPDSPTLAVGDSYAAVSNKLAIGSYTDPGSYALSVTGAGYFSTDLSLAGTTGITLSGNGAGIVFSGNGINAITTALNQNFAINPGGFGMVGINTDGVSPLANFDVRANIGTLAVASVSGTTSFASLVVNNDGVGDLLTASKSGLAIFTVKNNGQIAVGAPYYKTGACTLKTDVDGLVTCGTDLTGGGGGVSYVDQNNGLTFIGNTTTDFAIGGTSTSSAAFIFGGANSRTKGGIAIATFSGALMMEAQANSSSFDQTNWQQISGTAGTIGGGSTTQIASISAMASYNGSLYVGTSKNPSGAAGSAEVYRYNGNGTSWTLVSQSGGTGQIRSGDTTGIASISAMTVFNGNLYVGTSKMNSAEVYRYDGGTNWTKVSGPTAGTFATTGTSPSAIDGVSSLAIYQGQLYAGLREPGQARLLSYNGGLSWTQVNTTAGTFVATNTITVTSVGPMVVKNGFLYFATQREGDTDVIRYSGGNGATNAYFLSMNLASATGSYSINGTAVTAFSEATAMTVYNGAVIVALRRGNGQADVLQLNDGMSTGTTSPNSWTRLNNAVGQMTNLGTSGIDSVTALTVYNGLLYAGTNETGNAEIYRYTGGDQKWLEVSQPTSGQIASGGTAGIYGITNLVPINGDLYAGTNLGLKAEVYKLSNININKSYSVVFHASPSMGGGEQSGLDSTASIFFLASASANLGNTAGNTGAFIFDHGIQTRNGSYDVAEDYPTRDDTLKPGDVVAIDPNERGFVKKTSQAYDNNVLGVFSSNPALRLSQADAFISGGYVIPVALAGRVPVKVSTESGLIKPGDYLTPSSVPGVAMKAVKSSVVFAQAMEGYSGEKVGEVLSYIKSMTYQGAIADSFTNLDTSSPDFAVNVLDRLKTQSVSDGKSDVITDRLIAGLEIITPSVVTKNLTADTINAKTIKADHIEGLEIYTNRLGSLVDAVKSLEVLTNSQSVLGTSTSSASLVQNSTSEAQNPNLTNILTLSSLNVEGLATVSADLDVKGSGFFQGALNVLESITTQNLLVSQFAYFINDVVFKGNVRFNQTPTFSKDTAGFAVIKKDDDMVTVTFDQEYNQTPIVTASIALDRVGDSVLQKQFEDAVLGGSINYVITQRTTKDFVIKLKNPASQDLNFSWVALSVKDAKTSGSQNYQPSVTLMPSIMPSATATPSAGVQSILNQLNNSPGPPN